MSIAFVDLAAQQARIKPELDARIAAVLSHGKYIMGPEVTELEQRLAAFCGAGHCVTCANGTDALTMALMAAEVGPGDAVFVPSFTFTATAEVALLLGATPVFCDVDPDSFNLDPASLEAKLEEVTTAGDLRPRMVMPVDLFGLPADYSAIGRVAEKHGMTVLADAAQGFGGASGNRQVGALAPMTATSFFPAKPLGCYGDGGAVLTDDASLAEQWKSIRAHGKGGAKYDIVRVGLNSRLDTLQAAILLAKLDIFADEVAARNRVADAYDRRLTGHLATPKRYDGTVSAWAQYTVKVANRDVVQKTLQAAGVPSAVYYPMPMHLQTAYRAHGGGEGSLPVSERLAGEVLSLPMHPYLDDRAIATVCDALIDATRAAAAA